MRKRWVYINGEAYEVGVDSLPEPKAHYVMPDIKPYKSMIDGSYIGSRSTHREHLRAHGCIEVGNEKQTNKPFTPPPGLKDELIRVVNDKWRR